MANEDLFQLCKSETFIGVNGVTYFKNNRCDHTDQGSLDNTQYYTKLETDRRFGINMGTIQLLASNWIYASDFYYQIVTITSVTVNSKIDLYPTTEQLEQLQEDDISLVAENNNGTVTIYAVGSKPTIDYTIQYTRTEVIAE